jgi:hypothetical protein
LSTETQAIPVTVPTTHSNRFIPSAGGVFSSASSEVWPRQLQVGPWQRCPANVAVVDRSGVGGKVVV